MENNPVEDSPTFFWLGLVLIFIGVVAAWLFLVGPHFWVFGPDRRTKHGLVMIGVALAGAVLASFARPRPPLSSRTP